MSFAPTGDRVLLKEVPQDDVSPGGVVLPDGSRETPRCGVVVAVGRGSINDDGELVPVGVEKDELVVFARGAGTEIEMSELYGGGKFVLVSASDLLGVIERADG